MDADVLLSTDASSTQLEPENEPAAETKAETPSGREMGTETKSVGHPMRAERSRTRINSIQCTPHCSVSLQQQLHAAAAAVGWSLSRPPAGRQHAHSAAPYLAASLVWHEGSQGALTPRVHANQLLPHQWLSIITGLSAHTEKDAWERLLRHEQSGKFGRPVRSPRTLLLPEENAQLSALAEQRVFIAKPCDGSQGSNIIILRGRAEVVCWWRKQQEHSQCPDDLRYVLQDYVGEPLTLRNRKFDLRLYVVCVYPAPPHSLLVLASFGSGVQHRHVIVAVSAWVCMCARALVHRLAVDCNGKWEAYLYKEGMVRLCSLPYAAVARAGAETEMAKQHSNQDVEPRSLSAQLDAALPIDWQLAHLSNTSLKNLAMVGATPQSCTELMWGGLLHDAIKAGPAAGATSSTQEQDEGRGPIAEGDGERRVAAFWSEIVAIAEVTARALRNGVAVGVSDASTRDETAAGGTDSHGPTDNEAPEREARRDKETKRQPAIRCGMFQVLGLDVMLDAAHRAWVLEVNARPALAGTCSFE